MPLVLVLGIQQHVLPCSGIIVKLLINVHESLPVNKVDIVVVVKEHRRARVVPHVGEVYTHMGIGDGSWTSLPQHGTINWIHDWIQLRVQPLPKTLTMGSSNRVHT